MRPICWGMVCAACAGVAISACGTGSDVSATFSQPSGGVIPSGSSGAGGAGGAGASSSVASSGSGSGGSGGNGAGGAASSSAASSSASGAGGCDYSAAETCNTPTEITSIDGDQNNDKRTLTGTTSAWFKVFVNEGSVLSHQLSYTATLTSPPGMVFRLFAYPGDGNGYDCLGTTVPGSGVPSSVTDTWSDSFGSDDGRWIGLEVRYESGQQCNPAPKWTLTVEGHTNP